MRIGALACLVAVARAQSKAPPRGGGAAPCPTGWSRGQHDCEPDACNINRIKPPRHGSMGNDWCVCVCACAYM